MRLHLIVLVVLALLGCTQLATEGMLQQEGTEVASCVAVRNQYSTCNGSVYWGAVQVGKYSDGRITLLEVEGADAATFRYARGYGFDDFDVYVGTQALGADPHSFRLLDIPSHNPVNPNDKRRYALDNSNVYVSSRVIEGADPSTFEYLGYDYARDNDQIFYSGEAIEADYDTFQVIGAFAYDFAKDSSFIYKQGNRMIGPDVNSWEHIGGPHSKDAQHVYFHNEIIPGADPATFEKTEVSTVGQDAKYVYKHAERIGERTDVEPGQTEPRAEFDYIVDLQMCKNCSPYAGEYQRFDLAELEEKKSLLFADLLQDTYAFEEYLVLEDHETIGATNPENHDQLQGLRILLTREGVDHFKNLDVSVYGVKTFRQTIIKGPQEIPESDDELRTCQTDRDCIKVGASCCASSNCDYDTISKKFLDHWNSQIDCDGRVCTTMMCQDVRSAVCKEGTCVLRDSE